MSTTQISRSNVGYLQPNKAAATLGIYNPDKLTPRRVSTTQISRSNVGYPQPNKAAALELEQRWVCTTKATLGMYNQNKTWKQRWVPSTQLESAQHGGYTRDEKYLFLNKFIYIYLFITARGGLSVQLVGVTKPPP